LKESGRLEEQVKIVFAAHLTVAVMHGALETPAPLPAHLLYEKLILKINKILLRLKDKNTHTNGTTPK
jgi:hypothetical protein